MKRLLLAVFISAAVLAHTSLPAFGQDVKFELNDEFAVKANLDRLVGKQVTLRLISGEEMTGNLAEVGNSAAHLTQLAGKEFYDAVVPLEVITAVVVRVRK